MKSPYPRTALVATWLGDTVEMFEIEGGGWIYARHVGVPEWLVMMNPASVRPQTPAARDFLDAVKAGAR